MASFTCRAHGYISDQKRGKRGETRKGKIQKRIEEEKTGKRKDIALSSHK
jgi:hypothetical protein